MAITPNRDGTVSFSVIVGPGCGGNAGSDLIELIIKPEHFHSALARCERDEEAPTFPCHVGFSRITP